MSRLRWLLAIYWNLSCTSYRHYRSSSYCVRKETTSLCMYVKKTVQLIYFVKFAVALFFVHSIENNTQYIDAATAVCVWETICVSFSVIRKWQHRMKKNPRVCFFCIIFHPHIFPGQSVYTADELYSCDWQGKSSDEKYGRQHAKPTRFDFPCDVDVMKSIKFTIKRAQKPLVLMAMKFSALALHTFTRVSLNFRLCFTLSLTKLFSAPSKFLPCFFCLMTEVQRCTTLQFSREIFRLFCCVFVAVVEPVFVKNDTIFLLYSL